MGEHQHGSEKHIEATQDTADLVERMRIAYKGNPVMALSVLSNALGIAAARIGYRGHEGPCIRCTLRRLTTHFNCAQQAAMDDIERQVAELDGAKK